MFNVSFDASLNKLLNKQSRGRWTEMSRQSFDITLITFTISRIIWIWNWACRQIKHCCYCCWFEMPMMSPWRHAVVGRPTVILQSLISKKSLPPLVVGWPLTQPNHQFSLGRTFCVVTLVNIIPKFPMKNSKFLWDLSSKFNRLYLFMCMVIKRYKVFFENFAD